MAKSQNIVHEYFKKQLEDGIRILVKVNPYRFTGTEITISPQNETHIRELTFDEHIFEDLEADGFERCNPLEFNLYLSGLA
jgi:hypothetical protein